MHNGNGYDRNWIKTMERIDYVILNGLDIKIDGEVNFNNRKTNICKSDANQGMPWL